MEEVIKEELRGNKIISRTMNHHRRELLRDINIPIVIDDQHRSIDIKTGPLKN